MLLFKACFWPKKEPVLQKNGGPTEIILHFFPSFSVLSGFSPSQALASEPLAPIRPLPKKSCQKHYRRFFVHSGMCHNPRMKVETTGRNAGCEVWTAIRRRPAVCAKRLGLRNDSSAFGHPAGKRRWQARTPKSAGLSGAHHTQSNLIKANHTQSHVLLQSRKITHSQEDFLTQRRGGRREKGRSHSLLCELCACARSGKRNHCLRPAALLPQGLSGPVFLMFLCGNNSNPGHSWRIPRPRQTPKNHTKSGQIRVIPTKMKL
jgi:hypothetical protein